MGPLTCVVLKTIPCLKAHWNVISNPEFLMLFRTSSHIFGAKNVSECAIFYLLITSGLKTGASF